MRSFLKKTKHITCLVLLAAMVFTAVQLFPAKAASGAITVTGLLNDNAVLYVGDDLQAAFDAAQRGSLISINQFIELSADVVLRAEVWINNPDRITFGDYKILLADKGMMYLKSRLRGKYYGSLSPYSTVVMVEENDGYVYYLQAQEPSFGNAELTITRSNELRSGRVDEKAAKLYLDNVPAGLSVNSLIPLVSMSQQPSAETVNISVKNAAGGIVCTGSTLEFFAANTGSTSTATKSYAIVVLGDVNGNGRIDAADANQIACHAAGSVVLSGAALEAADTNRDGKVDAKDAEWICKKYISFENYTSPLV